MKQSKNNDFSSVIHLLKTAGEFFKDAQFYKNKKGFESTSEECSLLGKAMFDHALNRFYRKIKS